jgi:hypothetical protein
VFQSTNPRWIERQYNRPLKRAFPLQCPRVRWSDAREAWQIERQIHRARTVDPSTYPSEAVDSFLRFRDGFELIDELPPDGLPTPDRLIANLRKFDVTRMMEELGVHTADQLADLYDQRDARRREEARARRNREFRDRGGEIYDAIAWDEGRTVAVPRSYAFSERN